jgi:hypothetical protein
MVQEGCHHLQPNVPTQARRSASGKVLPLNVDVRCFSRVSTPVCSGFWKQGRAEASLGKT